MASCFSKDRGRIRRGSGRVKDRASDHEAAMMAAAKTSIDGKLRTLGRGTVDSTGNRRRKQYPDRERCNYLRCLGTRGL